MFVELDESVEGKVAFGDESKVAVKGKRKHFHSIEEWRSSIHFQCLLRAKHEKQLLEPRTTLRERL
jgi:predicted double-glycine peptidase